MRRLNRASLDDGSQPFARFEPGVLGYGKTGQTQVIVRPAINAFESDDPSGAVLAGSLWRRGTKSAGQRTDLDRRAAVGRAHDRSI